MIEEFKNLIIQMFQGFIHRYQRYRLILTKWWVL